MAINGSCAPKPFKVLLKVLNKIQLSRGNHQMNLFVILVVKTLR